MIYNNNNYYYYSILGYNFTPQKLLDTPHARPAH
jgi:hypothetical protein